MKYRRNKARRFLAKASNGGPDVLPILAAAASIGAAQSGTPPTTPTVVVKGRLSKTSDGQVKVDTTVHVHDEDVSTRYGPIWPSKAYQYRVGGHVTLACQINARGFAQSCDIAEETPLNRGFEHGLRRGLAADTAKPAGFSARRLASDRVGRDENRR